MKKFFITKETRIPFTKEGYEKVLLQKQNLLKERPDAVENLRKAREMGDLSENGYYKAARSRLSFIDAQLRKVNRLVKLGKVISVIHTGLVNIGNTVEIKDGETTKMYTIVGGYESDPTKNTISHQSPVGKALINKKPGDTVEIVTPKGIKHIIVLSVL